MIKNSRFLKLIMGMNALSCLLFGTIFIFWASPTTLFISGATNFDWLIRIVGFLLILNGLHLISAVVRNKLHKLEVLYFSVGDGIWVLATVIFVTMGWLIVTWKGIICAILIAVMVGMFGLLQFKALKS